MYKFLSKFDPYQLLFPIGILHGILGGVVWVQHAFFHTPYPGVEHAGSMFSGFLISFAAGFLLTAIPKFTGSSACSPLELGIALFLTTLTFASKSPLIPLSILLFITLFAIRRFQSRSYTPPPHFLFLPIGIILGMIGSVFLFLATRDGADPSWNINGRILLYYGTMLAFILGIGAKLVTALLGWAPLPTHQIQSAQRFKEASKIDFKIYLLPLAQAFIFVFSFVFELSGFEVLGRILRACIATWIGFQYWHLHQKPRTPGKLPRWIWISGWLLVLGLWVHAIFPKWGVHAAHLFFIGGYGLMTLMIGSRVSLAHGGFSPEIETRSRVFTITGALVILTMLTRVVAIAMPDTYLRHLGYAAATWILALLVWGSFFIPKILFRVGEHED